MNLYMTTFVWAFTQLISFPGYHQEWNQTLSGSWCSTSQQHKKFCLTLNYSATEIIFYSELVFRLKKTLFCESHIECTKGKREFLISLPNVCEAKQKSRKNLQPELKRIRENANLELEKHFLTFPSNINRKPFVFIPLLSAKKSDYETKLKSHKIGNSPTVVLLSRNQNKI